MEGLEEFSSSLPTPSVENSTNLASASSDQTSDITITQRHSRHSEDCEEVESDSGDSCDSSEESLVLINMSDRPKEQWDCQSILRCVTVCSGILYLT